MKRDIVDEALLDLAIAGELASKVKGRAKRPIDPDIQQSGQAFNLTDSEKIRLQSLRESVSALRAADDRLAVQCRGIKTIPPQAPLCKVCKAPKSLGGLFQPTCEKEECLVTFLRQGK